MSETATHQYYTDEGEFRFEPVRTLIPTMQLRWLPEFGGGRTLQQRFTTTGGESRWVNVPEL